MSEDAGPPGLMRSVVVRGAAGLALLDAMLFGVAGRLDWAAPWRLTVFFAAFFLGAGTWMVRHDPDLLRERMTTAENVPGWDRLVRVAYGVLMLALFVTAAFDAGRYRWSRMTFAPQLAGWACVIGSCASIWWCTAVNHFLSSDARLQSDRGQTVVQSGPYRFVRHPMYISIIVLTIGIALMLGSWLALLPAALIGVVFVIRTALEDRMLCDGLEGYRDYADRVRARLVPGLW
jgi:protein-S-isoprenylcysteine O-methyltransferase Ste14